MHKVFRIKAICHFTMTVICLKGVCKFFESWKLSGAYGDISFAQ